MFCSIDWRLRFIRPKMKAWEVLFNRLWISQSKGFEPLKIEKFIDLCFTWEVSTQLRFMQKIFSLGLQRCSLWPILYFHPVLPWKSTFWSWDHKFGIRPNFFLVFYIPPRGLQKKVTKFWATSFLALSDNKKHVFGGHFWGIIEKFATTKFFIFLDQRYPKTMHFHNKE